MAHVFTPPTRYWKCPACGITDQTQIADVHTQFHDCPATGGASIPLIEVQDLDAKVNGRQVVVQSEYDAGIAAVRTERFDGSNDLTVFPRAAVADGRGERIY
jgi:hypothetical protein